MCLTNSWCFVAPKMAWGEARRGSISAGICDRGATKPQAILGATLRAAVLLASRVVARSLQTAEGYARGSRLAGGQNPWLRNTSYMRDTTLALGGAPLAATLVRLPTGSSSGSSSSAKPRPSDRGRGRERRRGGTLSPILGGVRGPRASVLDCGGNPDSESGHAALVRQARPQRYQSRSK